MKITSNEEYGLRIILRVAKIASADHNKEDRLVTLNEIASNEGITSDYAMIFITALKNSKLLESVRGKNGGYKLTKKPEKINLLEVSKAMTAEIFNAEYCDKHSGGQMEHCIHGNECSIRSVWSTVASVLNNILANITLDQLMKHDEAELNKILSDKIKNGELAVL